MNETSPRARVARLVIKELPDEVLVYDLDTDKAYCLNQTAALVWKNCDGERTVAQLSQLMAQETASPMPDEIVWLALDQLDKFKLLESLPAKPVSLGRMNRRELVRHTGFAILALPLIISIVAPPAQAQASDCKNQPCSTSLECCPSHPDCGPSNMCKKN